MSSSAMPIPLPLARRIVIVVCGAPSPGLAAWVASMGAMLQEDLSPVELELVLTESLRDAHREMKAVFGKGGFDPRDCGPLLPATMRGQMDQLHRRRLEEPTPDEPSPPQKQEPSGDPTGDDPTGDPLPPDDVALAAFAAGRKAGLAGMLTRDELAGVSSDWLAGYQEGCRERERNERAAQDQKRSGRKVERRGRE